ncbi:flavin reductase [Streptomyces massasporeus]|uniref:flavin reductase n=1 Tax=Streptomyces massasporeus TaxID=67324 RepID=UPI003406AF48
MPVPPQRDVRVTAERLAAWFGDRLPGATDVAVSGLDTAAGAGFTNETLIIRLTWRDAEGTTHTDAVVLRVAPTRHQVHPDSRFATQVRLQRILAAETDLPVPSVLWHEEDPSVLGAPFMIMEKVDGKVPADVPSYHRSGWVADLAPPQRGALWLAGLDVLARLHALDTEPLGLDFLSAGDPRPYLDRQLDHYDTHFTFYAPHGPPAARRALAWLRNHRPPETGPVRLLWGDARLGNLIFQNLSPTAVLDWDMAETGPPESDVAWFLHLDRHLSEGIGVPRLTGMPGRTETVRRYERLTGTRLRHMEYHEVFAAFRFCLITARVTALLGGDIPLHRNATQLLERTLAERAPSALTAPCPRTAPKEDIMPTRTTDPINTAVFRDAFAALPTSVAVITTTDAHGTPKGLTSNAVCAVSMDPPLLLICVDKSSRTLPALLQAEGFVVNFLSEDAEHVSRKFATKSGDKFAEVQYRAASRAADSPVLYADSAVHLECATESRIEAGDHWILLGRVLDGAVHDRGVLLYHRRSYLKLRPERNAS